MSHSQRALQIFDQEGERAMLAYVALNAALKESEAAFLDEGGAILCQFADENSRDGVSPPGRTGSLP